MPSVRIRYFLIFIDYWFPAAGIGINIIFMFNIQDRNSIYGINQILQTVRGIKIIILYFVYNIINKLIIAVMLKV